MAPEIIGDGPLGAVACGGGAGDALAAQQAAAPARHAFGTQGLYLGARVEMACIAITK